MMIFSNKESKKEASVERIEASVKWYNPEKGYGFLNRGDNSGDIMLHFSALDKIGCAYVKVGDQVICDVVSGKFGGQVVQVIEVKFGSSEPRSFSSFLGSQLSSFDPKSLEDIEGTIKWYHSKKGYGFIYPDDGGSEIFLHSLVLRAAGYKYLEPGVRISAKVSNTEKGREAQVIVVLHEAEKT